MTVFQCIRRLVSEAKALTKFSTWVSFLRTQVFRLPCSSVAVQMSANDEIIIPPSFFISDAVRRAHAFCAIRSWARFNESPLPPSDGDPVMKKATADVSRRGHHLSRPCPDMMLKETGIFHKVPSKSYHTLVDSCVSSVKMV